MTTPEADDPILRSLRRLQTLESDPVRAERVRMRCRATLSRPRHAERAPAGLTALVLESALVGLLGLSFLVGIIFDVLHLHAVP